MPKPRNLFMFKQKVANRVPVLAAATVIFFFAECK